ncbi:CHAT domain-containing protein [Laspinema olomoucense]|uniref:CHAT domain-containing protein n=1 Tax=Laspinema olomoucense D3b TaxID=2953688 RepID=A0ABT2NF35_9CYAN|nr:MULTISPECIES: CHAT domain-containing protein [unclassified Laspinema]MCT7975530.1 CHAT domain-containing protein [Laspinema sp. D3d]MCT7981288.1 CHAT domain-containing protein [Laspinema sp. D3b]MCT7990423.1 CHAT domain-containing protein [Laspinema sp. D3a]MCT7994805.1 CHAT domain-containing protein [Laspinema sp. D3c]
MATHGSFDPNIPLESWLALTMQQYPNPVDWAAFTLMGEAE